MASETKTGTSRRKSSTDTKTSASKPAVKTPGKTSATVKTGATTKASTSKRTATTPAPKQGAVAKAAPPAEKKTATRKRKATGQPITAEARLRHIEVAAYYLAEQSGFSRNPADCWIAAESEIDGLLLAGKLPA
ncbi:MAG TPA: DUF2934 domain-containing protein [Rhodocyclaceae bacterium]